MGLTPLAVAVVVGAVPAMVPAVQDPAQVTPSFAWPKGLRATVEVRQVADRTDQPHVETTTRCSLSCQPHAKGMLIACREPTISPEFPGEYSYVSDFLRIAAEFDWLVTAKGEFVGLTNTDRLMAAMWKLPGPSKVPPEHRQKVAELSMAANEADARNSWAMLVSAWTGPALPVGKDVHLQGDLEVPSVPGVPVRGRQTLRAERWVDCPGRAQARCIELHADSEMDPAGYADAMERFFKDNATRPLGDVIRKADFRRQVVLVTDPATLIPYRLVVKSQSIVAVGDGKEARQDIEKTWTFTYPADKKSAPGPYASNRQEHQPSADLQVANIAQAVERRAPDDKRPDFCQDFNLTSAQIRAFLANAREVDATQFHDEPWLPCLVLADVGQSSREYKATISASFVARLSYPDGSQRWLVCDKACQATLGYDWSK